MAKLKKLDQIKAARFSLLYDNNILIIKRNKLESLQLRRKKKSSKKFYAAESAANRLAASIQKISINELLRKEIKKIDKQISILTKQIEVLRKNRYLSEQEYEFDNIFNN